MSTKLLTFAAITSEMTAIALLLLHSSSVTMLCAYLLLHGIAQSRDNP
ncbi:MAG: hypothetical protein U1E88_05795 [Acinetobacter sp.]